MGQSQLNFCYCGHDYAAQHNNGGACAVCPDAHAFVPDYQHNNAAGGVSGTPYATSVLSESQI